MGTTQSSVDLSGTVLVSLLTLKRNIQLSRNSASFRDGQLGVCDDLEFVPVAANVVPKQVNVFDNYGRATQSRVVLVGGPVARAEYTVQYYVDHAHFEADTIYIKTADFTRIYPNAVL